MSDVPPWIAEHLARGSYAALAEQASNLTGDPTGAARARAELAWLGLGPAYDLIAAARQAIAAGDASAPVLARRAPRVVLRSGVIAHAQVLAQEFGLAGDDRERFDEQVAMPGYRWYGDDGAWWKAECGADTDASRSARAPDERSEPPPEVAGGPGRGDARAALPLGAIVDDAGRPAAVRWWAADRLVAGAAAAGDVTAARLWAEAAAAIDGDGVDERRLRAALWQWRDGATTDAAGLVRKVAGDIRASKPNPAARGLLADAEAALAAIDHAGAQPRWLTSGPTGDALAQQLAAAPTAAHALRAARAVGSAVRATVTPAMVADAFAAGAAVWVELDGTPRLAALRAIDADSGMVVVTRGDRTALAPWARLERRSGPFGLGALIISAGEAPAIAADPRLARLDDCDLDAHGEAPPRGFVFHTARTALAEDPTWARALWRWGRELSAAFEHGHAESKDVLTWYADAREHVAAASWTFAIYAQVLHARGRLQEAVLAWRDAVARAPGDDGLAARCAAALQASGRSSAALAVLAPALGRAPGLGGAYDTAAQALLATGELDRARAAAELELARASGSIGAWHALVSALERAGDGDRARSALARACGLNPGHAGLALRAAVAAGRAGAWSDAHVHATDMIAIADDPNTTALAARLRWSDGDLDGAWAGFRAAYDRHGPGDHLLSVAVHSLAAMSPDARAAALAPVVAGASPPALASWAYALSEGELHADAVALADRAADAGLPNGLWHAARSRLRHEAAGAAVDRARIVTVLRELLGPNPDYALGRYALASTLLFDDPDAALAVIDHDLADLTPLRWIIEAEALERLGQADDAARLRARLADAGASIGAGSVGSARRVGTPARAAVLAAAARAAGGDHVNLFAEHAACLAAAGDLDGAAAALAPLAERDEPGPDWLIAKVALEAGVPAAAARAARRSAIDLADTRSWHLDDGADPWWYTAVLAVAEPDSGARARLEARAPRHPSAWQVIARGRRGAPGAAADRDRLARLAPGLVPTEGARS